MLGQVEGDEKANLAKGLLTVQEGSGRMLPNLNLKFGEVEIISTFPIGSNGCFDMFEGRYLKGKKCLIKTLRGFPMFPYVSEKRMALSFWGRF